MRLDKRELATVFAALRAWQENRAGNEETFGYLDYFEDAEPLTSEEVDALCERLNTEEDDEPDAEPEQEDHTGEVYRAYYQIKGERTPRFGDFDENSEADTYTEEQLIAEILSGAEGLPVGLRAEDVEIISREWLDQWEADHEFQR